MDSALGLLDRLPAPIRHAVIGGGAAAGSTVTAAIIHSQGVTRVEWGSTLLQAIDKGFLAAAITVSALALTPLTRQYGLFGKGRA